MRSFLEDILEYLKEDTHPLEDTIFVLPSKRAGTFLRRAIARDAKKTMFSPEIYSIESFVETISGISYATNTQQLFELYDVYQHTAKHQKDNFFTFSKWGQTLVQDINEIDRYLVDASALFSNLSAIQEVSHWSLEGSKTQMITDYLAFWNGLEELYTNFNTALLAKGLGHQGLVYRKACEQLAGYLKKKTDKKFVFVGFSALNKAESQIIETILEHATSTIFWDIDSYFLNDPIHDASFFIRAHRKSWPYLQQHALKGVSTHYSSDKNIQVIGVPKSISQAKYVGKILAKLHHDEKGSLKKTAVVLADESLLNPILNAIPEEIESVNITMGYPLDKTPFADFFTQFIALYSTTEQQGWYYRTILEFLSHPYIKFLLRDGDTDYATTISTEIKDKNWTLLTPEKLNRHPAIADALGLLFFEGRPSTAKLVERCLALISSLKSKFEPLDDTLSLEYLYRFFKLFNQLLDLIQKNDFINDLKSLQGLFKELLSSETVDFQGNPLDGLQIMGMLESRNLDFETIIVTSVNEGILPSGKSNNSFIPFDLKINFGLPTYKEKDAVYTYHFYRLLQRAKHIYLVYNIEPDVLEGGEKSRLITQLLTDPNKTGQIHSHIALPKITPNKKELDCIHKNPEILQLLKQHASRGFSPTSLSTYIRNPIDFYKRYLLNISDVLEVEETIAANTFGTIIHDTLEQLYTPFVGKILTVEQLKSAKKLVPSVVKSHFSKSYKEGDISTGKNLIALKVIERYLINFLSKEIADCENHEIEILGVEQQLSIPLYIPEIAFPVMLKGKLDRIDRRDGTLRIIDYKTGKVETKNVELVDWETITTDNDSSKAFQLLCYALMYTHATPTEILESGIISFKNLNAGALRFAIKPSKGSRSKEYSITTDTLSTFRKELHRLLTEICSLEHAFIEKET